MKDLLKLMFLPLVVKYYDLTNRKHLGERCATSIDEKYHMYLSKYNIEMLKYIRKPLALDVEVFLYERSVDNGYAGEWNKILFLLKYISCPNKFIEEKITSLEVTDMSLLFNYVDRKISFSKPTQIKLVEKCNSAYKNIKNPDDELRQLHAYIHKL